MNMPAVSQSCCPATTRHDALVRDLPRAVRRHCPGAMRQTADDICQAAAAQVLARSRQQPDTTVTPAYVRSAARNAVIDVVRKQSRRDRWWATHSAQMQTRSQRDPERLLMDSQLRERVRWHLSQLPESRREVVLLHVEGYGITEIATRLGCNRKRADNLVRRGLATLRQALRDEGVEAA